MKGLSCYGVGMLLVSGGAGTIGGIVFALGILLHWKWWLLAIVSFTVGVRLG